MLGAAVRPSFGSSLSVVYVLRDDLRPMMCPKQRRQVVPKGSTLNTGTSACYEVLGFDVMLDANMKASDPMPNHPPLNRSLSKSIPLGVVSETRAQSQQHK